MIGHIAPLVAPPCAMSERAEAPAARPGPPSRPRRAPRPLASLAWCRPEAEGRRQPAEVVQLGDASAGGEGEAAPGGEDEASPSDAASERILVSEVEIKGCSGELAAVAAAALTIRPNFAYTLAEVQEEVQRVFATGYFSTCQPVAEDTRDGVRVVLQVKPNPELRGVVVLGADALPARVVTDAFAGQHSRTLNFAAFNGALRAINEWYEQRGIFGSVVDASLSESGVCELRCAEARVARVSVRTLDRASGEPTRGATRPEVVQRALTLRPGSVYSVRQARRDLDAIYSTGVFEDVSLVPSPAAEGEGALDLTVSVVERKTGGFSAGGGMSARGLKGGALSGMVGSCAYTQKNLFGLNQKLAASVEAGAVEKLFRISHTDPWIRSDRSRTSRTLSLANTRGSGAAIHGRAQAPTAEQAAECAAATASAAAASGSPAAASADEAASAAAAGGVVVQRLIAACEYSRPLAPGWTASYGVTLQRSGCRDEQGRPLVRDAYGRPLQFSTTAEEDVMALCHARLAYSAAGGAAASFLVSAEQAAPLQPHWLSMSRLQVRAERTVALGGRGVRLTMAAKGGVILGDLPPYEAFPVGGTNSVRGYDEGGVGCGARFAVGSVELQAPLAGAASAVIFADAGSDLDTGGSVLGDPGGTRGKPGRGCGAGAGLRLDSPLGPWRLEYAVNDGGARRFHLGMGRAF